MSKGDSMPSSRNRSRAVVRTPAGLTLALYAVIAILLALSFAFPDWGKDRVQHSNDFLVIYFPPQLVAAVYIGLAAFAVSALLGVVCAIVSRREGRGGWAMGFAVMTALALQGPFFIGLELFAPRISLPPSLVLACVIVAVAAFLIIPVLGLVFARGGRAGVA